MQQCYDQLMARAAADTTHAAIEQVGTMSTNIALDYYNHYLEEAMPWIERAEKALDLLAEHNKKSQQPSNEPVMLYTDGLNEAENRQQEQYGEDRIIQLMTSHASLSMRDIIEALKADIDQFRDGAEQNDDLTMLAFRITNRL